MGYTAYRPDVDAYIRRNNPKGMYWIVTPLGALDDSYSTVVEARKAVIRMDRRLGYEWYSVTWCESMPSQSNRQMKKFMGQVIKGPRGGFVWWEENGTEHAINRDGTLGRRL